MRKVIMPDGTIRMNELTFFEFSGCLRGFDVCSRGTKNIIPRFILYWRGFTLAQIKEKFDLKPRKYDN